MLTHQLHLRPGQMLVVPVLDVQSRVVDHQHRVRTTDQGIRLAARTASRAAPFQDGRR
jgi:hypothetical protein